RNFRVVRRISKITTDFYTSTGDSALTFKALVDLSSRRLRTTLARKHISRPLTIHLVCCYSTSTIGHTLRLQTNWPAKQTPTSSTTTSTVTTASSTHDELHQGLQCGGNL